MLIIEIPGAPDTVTAQQKGQRIIRRKDGSAFVHHYKKKRVQDEEKRLAYHIGKHRPPEPLDGPQTLLIRVVYPWAKSTPKKTVREFRLVPKTTFPDGDNVLKMVKDVLEAEQIVVNDSRFCFEQVTRYWGDPEAAGITICIYTGPEPVRRGEP